VEVQLHAFLISALDRSEWSVHALATLLMWKGPPVPTEYEAGWVPEPVWTW